jgi:hypothetical protein
MSLLYYLPERSGQVSPDDLAALGLAHLAGESLAACDCLHGPDDKHGLVFAARVDAAQVGYFPDHQIWQQIADKLWLGRFRNRPILSEQLARARQLRGHLVTLADDRPWLVPVAREFGDEGGQVRYYRSLPSVARMGPGGVWEPGGVMRCYARLWDIAESWAAVRLGAARAARESARGHAAGDQQDYTYHGGLAAAVEVLTVNYLVGGPEVSFLGLLTAEIGAAILDALIDFPMGLEALEKKSSRVTPSGSAGPAGSIPGTHPP